MSGLEELDALERRLLGALPRAAARAAPGVLAAFVEHTTGGRSPSGEAWPLRAAGGVALLGLTSQATARAEGPAVVLKLPELLRVHQVGDGHSPRRQVVPDDGEKLPETYARAMLDALEVELG